MKAGFIRNPANRWRRVVFAAECDPDTDECPVCGIDYALCDCPGPTQEEEFEYREIDGVMWARRLPRALARYLRV